MSARATLRASQTLLLLFCLGSAVALGSRADPLVASPPQSAPSGQSRTAADQQAPTFRTEANFVRVDVYPTQNGIAVEDLRREEFDVLEDGRPQTIDTFDHVVVRTGRPQEARVEPNTVAQSRQMAADARARVFVLFLDFNHVDVAGSHAIRQPLVNALDRAIGADDLVAVMTPEMTASQITFARRTDTIEAILTRYWPWGERDQVSSKDPIEDEYRACFPGFGPTRVCPDDDRGVADEMIERRREKQTFDALRDLVGYLRTVREERKAILVISDGWKLFRPDPTLARSLYCQAPTGAPVGVDPRTGKLSTTPPPGVPSSAHCERDRMALSQMDDERDFRAMVEAANRSNCTFYPIDPRGLAVFDSSIGRSTTGIPPAGSTTITPPAIDMANLRDRIDSLRTLAEGTDGLAVVDTNDLAGGIRRIVGDLTSYYLLGYYSTGRLDGRFHSITVRVKRPGVQVRARRGYRALTPAAAAPPTSAGAVDPAAAAVNAAVAGLAAVRRDAPIHFRVGYGFGLLTAAPATRAIAPTIWVAAELDADRSLNAEWKGGGTIVATVSRADGGPAFTVQGTLDAVRSRWLSLRLPPDSHIESGEYVVRLDARPAAGIPISETARVTVPRAADACGDAMLFRRGPFTGPDWQPVGDLRFRRQERIRVDVPVTTTGGTETMRVLGRNGSPLQVPVTVGMGINDVNEPDRSQMVRGELSLAPLAPGDYVLEIAVTRSGNQQRKLVAFRIVPN